MADITYPVVGDVSKKLKDMGDGTYAEVVSGVVATGDIEIGAVEIKDGVADIRQTVLAASTAVVATDKPAVVALHPLSNGVVSSPVAITTATHSNVVAANADTALLASNANRKPGSTIVNDSTAILYIKLGSGASATSYMVAIDGKTTVPGIFPVPDGYTGAVNGFWASATGSARVTEMT